MKSSWVGLAFPAAVILVLVIGGVIYLRSGSTPETRPAEAPAVAEPRKRSERVEHRLQQLRDAHALAAQAGEKGEKIDEKSGISGAPAMGVRPRPRAAPANSQAQGKAAAEANAGSDATADIEDDPDDIPGLRRMALEDKDAERRLAAVTLLGASDDPAAIPILAQSLQDQDEEVRLAAIQSLADVTGEVPIDVIGGAVLNDPSADNRYEALEVLSDIGGDAARAYIEKAMNDPDEDVRSLAEGLLDNEDTYEDSAAPAEAHPAGPAGAMNQGAPHK